MDKCIRSSSIANPFIYTYPYVVDRVNGYPTYADGIVVLIYITSIARLSVFLVRRPPPGSGHCC